MKTLSAWILGIFALGLAVGSFVSGSGAVPELGDSDRELERAPAARLQDVDCGDGREALLEPVDVNGTTSFKVRCVRTETPPPTRVASQPAPVLAAPPPLPQVDEPEDADVPGDIDDADDTRTWKQSAVVIGGAAGAGAGIGALAKGKKGAAVGAAIGAASGAAYEILKKDEND